MNDKRMKFKMQMQIFIAKLSIKQLYTEQIQFGLARF